MTLNIKYAYDFIVFIFIFSIFNDTFLVEQTTSGITKLIAALFILITFYSLTKYIFNSSNSKEMSFFYFFILSLTIPMLITTILYDRTNLLISNFMLLISTFVVFVFFSYYDINKALFFTWISLVISILICYSSDPFSIYTFRKTGGTGDPNEFSTQVILFLMVSLYLTKIYNKKLIILLSFPLFLYGIFFAGSMSSFLTLSILLVIFLITNIQIYKNTNFILAIAISIIIFLLSLNYILEIEVVKNMLGRSSDLDTADQRFAAWIAGYNMIKEHVFFGVGQSAFPIMASEYLETYAEKGLLWSHNIFIQLFSESGLFCYILFTIFLIKIFMKDFIKNIHNKNKFILLSAIGAIIMGGTLGLLYKKFFWFTLALYFNIKDKK